MIGIPLAILGANATEWVVHKHVLHGLGRNRASWWAFHWHTHHRNARRQHFRDEEYERSVLEPGNAKQKEALALIAGGLLVAPLLPVAPFFTVTAWLCGVDYYIKHRRSHLDPEWARQHLPWHYDHHMGPNQDANWCVTRPWMDIVMGTREPYVGTERERQDLARAEARRAERAARAAAEADVSPTPTPSAASSRSSKPATPRRRKAAPARASGPPRSPR